MSIANYSELKTAVANWINRSDLTSYIPDLIALGETRIYRDLRIRAMETALSSAISSGLISLPSDFVELKHAYVNSTPVKNLVVKDAEWIYLNYPTRSSTGTPAFIGIDAGNFIFGPYPDSAYTVKGTYYKRLVALSDSNTTNWFTANAPGILLFAALAETEVFLKNDSRTLLWSDKYEQEKNGILMEEKKSRLSGSLYMSPA